MKINLDIISRYGKMKLIGRTKLWVTFIKRVLSDGEVSDFLLSAVVLPNAKCEALLHISAGNFIFKEKNGRG